MTKAKDWPLKIETAPDADLCYWSNGWHNPRLFVRAVAEYRRIKENNGWYPAPRPTRPAKTEHIYVRIQAPQFGDDECAYYISEVNGPARFARKATVLR